jgi:DNA-binding MarR family transcriptional regulator
MVEYVDLGIAKESSLHAKEVEAVNDTETGVRAEDLATAVRRLDMALARWHAEVADRLHMDGAELLVLARLAMDESQGPADLARSLHMTSGAMTAVLDRLTAHGHLVRQPHPTDRRRVLLHLTENAHQAGREQVVPMAASIADLGRRLSPAERETVGRFLEDLIAIVSAAAGSPPGPVERP